MILHELTGLDENHPIYRAMELDNGRRHYDFLKSAVDAALGINGPFLSQTVLKAINSHAIVCLHPYAGEYRPCRVDVRDVRTGEVRYEPPDHYRVPALMDDFVNRVNRFWDRCDAVLLASYVLWRLNQIHPFINGNGRTARAASYFVLCLKWGRWPAGNPILPELLRQSSVRAEYTAALRAADHAMSEHGFRIENLDLLKDLVTKLLAQQVGIVLPKS